MTIARKSSTLTARLTTALQPLLGQQSEHKTTDELSRSIDCIMRLALQIRSLSLVSTEDYDSIWPLLGSSFDENEMETKHSGSNTAKNLVRLPLCPGLRAYRKATSLVADHGFGKGERGRTPKYKVKALVLT